MTESPRLVQIGWLMEDLPDEDALGEFVADSQDAQQTTNLEVFALYEGTADTVVQHSHRNGVKSRLLPVYVGWVPTDIEDDS